MGAEIKKSSHDAFYTKIKIQVESKKTLVGYDVAARGWINKLQQMVDDGFKSTEADALIKKIQKLLVEKDHAEDQINADTHNKAEAVKPTIRKKAKTYPTVPDTLSRKEIAEITRITKQEAEQNGVNYEKTLLFLCPFINISPARANIDEVFARKLMWRQNELNKGVPGKGINIDGIFGDITSAMLVTKHILGDAKKEKAFIAISENSDFLLNIYDKVEKGEQLSNEDIKSVLKINNEAYTNGIENNMVTQLILVRAMAKKDAEGNPVNQKLVDSVAESQETKKAAHANTPEGIAQAEEYEDALGKDLFGVITDPNSTAKDIGKALIQSGLPIQLAVLGIFAYMAFGGIGSFTKGLAILGIGVAGGVIAGANGFTLDRIGEAFFGGDDENNPDSPTATLSAEFKAQRDKVAATIPDSSLVHVDSKNLEDTPKLQLKRFLANVQITGNNNPTNKIHQKDAENVYHTMKKNPVFYATPISQIQSQISDLGDEAKGNAVLTKAPYSQARIENKPLTRDQLKTILESLLNTKDTTAGDVSSIYEGETSIVQAGLDVAGNVIDSAGDALSGAGDNFEEFIGYLGKQFGEGNTFDIAKVSDFFDGIDTSNFGTTLSTSGDAIGKALVGIGGLLVIGKDEVVELFEDGVIAFEENVMTIKKPEIFNKSLSQHKEAIDKKIKEITIISPESKNEIRQLSENFSQTVQTEINKVLDMDISMDNMRNKINEILKDIPNSEPVIGTIGTTFDNAIKGINKELEEMWNTIKSWKKSAPGSSGSVPLSIPRNVSDEKIKLQGYYPTVVMTISDKVFKNKLVAADTKNKLVAADTNNTSGTNGLLEDFKILFMERKGETPPLSIDDEKKMNSIIDSLTKITQIDKNTQTAGVRKVTTTPKQIWPSSNASNASTNNIPEDEKTESNVLSKEQVEKNNASINTKIEAKIKKIKNESLQDSLMTIHTGHKNDISKIPAYAGIDLSNEKPGDSALVVEITGLSSGFKEIPKTPPTTQTPSSTTKDSGANNQEADQKTQKQSPELTYIWDDRKFTVLINNPEYKSHLDKVKKLGGKIEAITSTITALKEENTALKEENKRKDIDAQKEVKNRDLIQENTIKIEKSIRQKSIINQELTLATQQLGEAKKRVGVDHLEASNNEIINLTRDLDSIDRNEAGYSMSEVIQDQDNLLKIQAHYNILKEFYNEGELTGLEKIEEELSKIDALLKTSPGENILPLEVSKILKNNGDSATNLQDLTDLAKKPGFFEGFFSQIDTNKHFIPTAFFKEWFKSDKTGDSIQKLMEQQLKADALRIETLIANTAQGLAIRSPETKTTWTNNIQILERYITKLEEFNLTSDKKTGRAGIEKIKNLIKKYEDSENGINNSNSNGDPQNTGSQSTPKQGSNPQNNNLGGSLRFSGSNTEQNETSAIDIPKLLKSLESKFPESYNDFITLYNNEDPSVWSAELLRDRAVDVASNYFKGDEQVRMKDYILQQLKN